MDSIAVTKPDMAVTKRDRLGLSLFGLLSLAFGDEVRTRSAWQTGLYREVPLELLEEDEPVPISGSERELHLDVDLKVVLENLKQEHKQADKRQKQAAERILERVYLLERRISEAAPAGAHINVRIDPPQAGQAAAPNGQTANVPAAAKKNGATNEAQAVREKEILSVIRTALAEKDAQQRLQAAQMAEKEQAGRAASIARVMHRRQIGTQAAAAVRQARRAADGSLWRTVKQEQMGRLSAPLTPVSWSTAAPAGEGWTPRWQEEHPGFASKKETGGGQAAGGSILLPDQLRLRRQRALQQAAEAAAEPFAAGMRTAEGSLAHPDNAALEAAGIRQDETVRLLVQRLDRAVEQAVRRPARRETAATAEGASPVQQESPAEDARMAQPSGKTDGTRPAQGRTASAGQEARAEKQAAAVYEEPDAVPAAAVSGSAAARTEIAAAGAEHPGTADQNERPVQRAPGEADTAMQAVPSGAAAPQTGLPQEALLHRIDGQDSVQHVGGADGRASVQGQDDPAARKAQEGKQAAKIHMQPDDASRRSEQSVSGTSAASAGQTDARTASAAARVEQHGTAVQTPQTGQYERETIGTERQAALPGAAAPQAALPPEALLYRADMQDSSLIAQRGTSSVPGQERPDNRTLTGRDKPQSADTVSTAAPLAGTAPQKAAAPDAGTAPSLMPAGQNAQKPSGTDRQEQEINAAPQAKAVSRAYAAPNEQSALPAAPLIHREAAFDMEQNNQPGQPASIQKEGRFTPLPEQAQPHPERAAGRQTDTQQAGAVGRARDASSAQQPAGADAAAQTDSHTAERPMHTAVLPQKSGGVQAQTASERALPVKTEGVEGYAASEPLTWRTDAEPSAPQEQRTETAGKAQNAAAAPADTAYAEGKQQTTAVLSHKGRTDEIEYSTAHPSRSITGKPLSGHGPAPGNAGGAAQADAGLVYRTDTAQLQTAAQERQNGLPVQAKAIVTAAAGHGQPSDRLRTALRRSTEEILARPMKPVQTTLVRPQQAGNTAAVRPIETFTDAALQPGETASRRAAVMDGNELSYLPLQPAEQKTDQKASSQASALPDWAQRFLQQPAGADRQNTQRFSAVQQQSAAVPPGQIEWTAPGAVPKAAPIVFRENKQPEAQHPAAPARLSDSELRRAADKVYRMIEDRLRRELRRSGK
ncbi:MAG: hypothetical protein KH295_04760 [Clostridiaceae bacterium]|nr:hypothetical protein [Clostridiaceae bacterium]